MTKDLRGLTVSIRRIVVTVDDWFLELLMPMIPENLLLRILLG